MTEVIRFRCLNCGRRFDAEVLDERERETARRERRPTSPLQCPECRRTDLRRGWD